MLRDDDLEIGRKLLNQIVERLKHPSDSTDVGIVGLKIPETFLGSIQLLIRRCRWKVDLRWLVNNQEAGDRATVLDKMLMEREQSDQVAPKPVLTATHPMHGDWRVSIGDHGKARRVEPVGTSSKLKIKALRQLGHHTTNSIQD